MADDALLSGVKPEGSHGSYASPALIGEVPGPRVPFRRALFYASGNVGTGLYFALNSFVLSTYLPDLGAPPLLYGPLSNTDSIEGAVILPIVGAWSDRTWTRLGRRRPFIVAFIPLAALFIMATAFAPLAGAWGSRLGLSPRAYTLLLISAGIFLFTVTFNISRDPYSSLMADITPAEQRGHVNGLAQFIQLVGQVVMLLFGAYLLQFSHLPEGESIFILFVLTAVGIVVFFVPTVLGVREPRQLVDRRTRQRYTVRQYWHALRGEREIQLFFAAQFFLWLGINTMKPFLIPYARGVIGLTAGEAFLLAFVLLISTAIFTWPFGVLSDRIGLKPIFVVGMVLMAGASITGIWVRQPVVIFPTLFVAGIGNAAQTASSYPLLTRLARPDRIGLYTGLSSAITSIASPGATVIAAALVGSAGFTLLFPFIAAMFLLSLIPLALLSVRAGEAKVRAELAETP
jgi:maltose/moltooligosaccharide transporter